MRWGKHWLLRATPANDSALARRLADSWNERPELYRSKRAAESAAHSYTRVLLLPLSFWVIDTKDDA